MSIPTRCPFCRTLFQIREEFAGTHVPCRECGERFLVSEESEEGYDGPPRRARPRPRPRKSESGGTGAVVGIVAAGIGFVVVFAVMYASVRVKQGPRQPPPPRIEMPPAAMGPDFFPPRPMPAGGVDADEPPDGPLLFTLSNVRQATGFAGRPVYTVDLSVAEGKVPFGPGYLLVVEKDDQKHEFRLNPQDLRKRSLSFDRFGGGMGGRPGAGEMRVFIERENIAAFGRGQGRVRVSNVATLE